MLEIKYTDELKHVGSTDTFLDRSDALHLNLESGILSVKDFTQKEWDIFIASGELEAADKAVGQLPSIEEALVWQEHQAEKLVAEKAEFLSKRQNSK